MEEKCYKHPDRIAAAWRETFIFGEPDRVPLCNECILKDRKYSAVYPLNERRMHEN